MPGTVAMIQAGASSRPWCWERSPSRWCRSVGGASLGPEDALGKMGGGLGTWISERQKLSDDLRATNTLSGMSAGYGGLLSSPILASILTLEIARPSAARFADTLVGGLLAASVAFAVFFPIAGSTFVGLYELPSYEYEDWQHARGRSPRPRRRRARADHRRRDRAHEETHGPARRSSRSCGRSSAGSPSGSSASPCP